MKTTVYVTKYALTKGIKKVVAEVDETYAWIPIPGMNSRQNIGRRDFFLTMEEAQADLKKKAVAKIASLKKQIVRMQSIVDAERSSEDE
jgi:hypothetical protein